MAGPSGALPDDQGPRAAWRRNRGYPTLPGEAVRPEGPMTAEPTRPTPGDPDTRPADLVLTEARVLTLAADSPRADGLAARDGRVVALGSAADLRAYVGPRTEVLDVGGKVVLPGFVDSHNHLLWAGLSSVRPALGE